MTEYEVGDLSDAGARAGAGQHEGPLRRPDPRQDSKVLRSRGDPARQHLHQVGEHQRDPMETRVHLRGRQVVSQLEEEDVRTAHL